MAEWVMGLISVLLCLFEGYCIHDGYYLVEPVAGSTELNSADQITVPMTNMNPSPEPEVGDVLEIEYDGSIEESYPAQITNVHSISVVE